MAAWCWWPRRSLRVECPTRLPNWSSALPRGSAGSRSHDPHRPSAARSPASAAPDRDRCLAIRLGAACGLQRGSCLPDQFESEPAELGLLARQVGADCARSEEHTSELQSLMRRAYAVYCLKKKT